MKKLLLCLLISLGLTTQAQVQISLVPFVTGLNRPIALTSAGDNRLFCVEKAGRIMIADSNGQLLPDAFLDIRSRVRSNGGEQGLLGLAFHPDYVQNGWFYVHYIFGDGRSMIARFERDSLNPNLADPASEKVLLQVSQPFANHNAGDLAFGPDGYLYIPMGDGGSAGDPGARAQNLKVLLGKILRIDVDTAEAYRIPPDNPFANDTSALDEIWSYGWRNPWRFSFDRLTGDMWVGDVGQNLYEEISVEWAGVPGGQNYGWRCIEGNSPFNGLNCGPIGLFVPPVHVYQHSNATGRSVTGGYVYRGNQHPGLQGHYIFGDYESGNVWTLLPQGGGLLSVQPQGQLLGLQQISAFGQGADGELYVAAYKEGKVYQIIDNATAIEPDPLAPGLELYPNPGQNEVFVRWQNPPALPFELHLRQLNGQSLRSYAGQAVSSQRLDLHGLPAGIYVLELKGERSAYRKLVIY